MAPGSDSKTRPETAESIPEATDTPAEQLTTPKKADSSAKASQSSTPAKASSVADSSREEGEASSSPEPEESSKAAAAPPLPNEPLPQQDDGWEPVWDSTNQAWYFYNRFTQKTQWTNPRVPEATPAAGGAPGVAAPAEASGSAAAAAATALSAPDSVAGGYNPAIHGDYDPNAWYAQPARDSAAGGPEATAEQLAAAAEQYEAGAFFNRATGAWQQAGEGGAGVGGERQSDEARARRQMNAFFDVDAAANMHDGRSLKAERSGKKPSKSELKAFKEKRRAKKEEKRRAWLRD